MSSLIGGNDHGSQEKNQGTSGQIGGEIRSGQDQRPEEALQVREKGSSISPAGGEGSEEGQQAPSGGTTFGPDGPQEAREGSGAAQGSEACTEKGSGPGKGEGRGEEAIVPVAAAGDWFGRDYQHRQ